MIILSDLHFKNASILMTLVIIESMFHTQLNVVWAFTEMNGIIGSSSVALQV